MLRTGEGGLEVRGDGPGPAVPLDLHPGGTGGHRGHYPAGAYSLRRPDAHRQEVQRVRDHDGGEVSAPAVVHARALHRRERLRTERGPETTRPSLRRVTQAPFSIILKRNYGKRAPFLLAKRERESDRE